MNEPVENNESLNNIATSDLTQNITPVANDNIGTETEINNQNVLDSVSDNGVNASPNLNNEVNFSQEPEKIETDPEITLNNNEINPEKEKMAFKESLSAALTKNKKALVIILLVAFILSLSASGVLAYSVVTKNKILKDKDAAIASKDEESINKDATILQLQDELATATATPAVETPVAATPTPTTTKKTTTTTTQESVVLPPPPPE